MSYTKKTFLMAAATALILTGQFESAAATETTSAVGNLGISPTTSSATTTTTGTTATTSTTGTTGATTTTGTSATTPANILPTASTSSSSTTTTPASTTATILPVATSSTTPTATTTPATTAATTSTGTASTTTSSTASTHTKEELENYNSKTQGYNVKSFTSGTVRNSGTLKEDALTTEDERAKTEAIEKLKTFGIDSSKFVEDKQLTRIRNWAKNQAKSEITSQPTFFDDSFDNKDKDLPGIDDQALFISYDKGYVWGNEDLETISDVLGYPTNAVSRKCYVRIETALKADKKGYVRQILPGNKSSIKYEDSFKYLTLTAWAVCNIPPSGKLPNSSSIIGKVGKTRYSVNLGLSNDCLPPTNNEKFLSIGYTGNKTFTCSYTK